MEAGRAVFSWVSVTTTGNERQCKPGLSTVQMSEAGAHRASWIEK